MSFLSVLDSQQNYWSILSRIRKTGKRLKEGLVDTVRLWLCLMKILTSTAGYQCLQIKVTAFSALSTICDFNQKNTSER